MKISSLLHGFNPELEERKRSQQRREVGEVYKKHAKYADAQKNPMLKALENLLSGKTEKELHEADAAVRKDLQQSVTAQTVLPVQTERKKPAQIEQQAPVPELNELSEETVRVLELPASVGEEPDETVHLLENIRQAALAPAVPSPQDLRVAASASAQLQQTAAQQTGIPVEADLPEETAPFADMDFTFDVPERFQKDFARDPEQQTVFGQELEKLLFQRSFNTAAQKYSSHIAMVNNGYRLTDEPLFSQTA